MASFKKLPSGLIQVQIFRRGVRRSDSFPSKGAAVAWAGQQEAEIMAGVRGQVPNLTVLALFQRYEKEVSEHKKGKRWEVIRLKALGLDPLASVRLRKLDTQDVAAWQQRWLARMKSASVRRVRNLLNNVFEIGVNEWHWLAKNPFGPRGKSVRRPKDSKPRDRIASPAEIAWLTENASDNLRRAIVGALETAMRAGELASQPSLNGRTAKLPDSKNGEGRVVPLSGKALDQFQEGIGITAGSISTQFARLCRAGKIKGLTFHDLKHTAMTALSKKLDPWELAKMTGNKDINILLNTYYHHDPEETAKKL